MATLLVLVAVAALGAWLSVHVWRALRSGTANVHDALIRRRERPAYYWTAVVVQAAFAAVCVIVVARGLARWTGSPPHPRGTAVGG